MAKKSKGIALLLLLVLLLILISSRMTPREALRPNAPTVTDDPLPSETPAPEETPEPTPEPTPPPNIRNVLPGVSRGDWNLKLVNNPNLRPRRDRRAGRPVF